ncbi:MAG TPA: RecX family transcriptional regulator [Bryobacteraceae bacterium]|nr:RecX family transcriptional regulator [Bryobacteraceae bacterium]
MAKPLDAQGLMTFAAKALSARALTVSELREKLRRRAAEPADVDQVLARLKESGYLNDKRFADSYASWRRDGAGFGKTRVMRDLMARRVAPAVARQAAEAAYQEADEVAMIEKFLERKYRGKDLGSLLKEPRHLASAYRRLRVSGFSTGNSVRVLKRYAEQAELLEETEEEGA